MITTWTLFITFLILGIGCLVSLIANIVNYLKGGKGEHRFTYLVATVICALVTASTADAIFS